MIKARFYGSSRLPYFEGWYLKQQNGRDTVALIPAIHIDRRGLFRFAASHYKRRKLRRQISYPAVFRCKKRPAVLRLGNNIFSGRGCHLFCQTLNLISRDAALWPHVPACRGYHGAIPIYSIYGIATAYSA